MRILLTTALIAIALCGCAGGFSGLGASSQYGCQAPKGSACTSISGVYANGPQGQRAPVNSGTNRIAITPYTASALSASSPATSTNTSPETARSESLRTTPRVLRLWIAPWEDSDGDLHDESTLHVLVNTGRWRVPHVRPAQKPAQDVKAPATTGQETGPTRPGTTSTPIAPH